MPDTLHLKTSTLVVRLPENIGIPEYQEKPRTKKAILRMIIQTLQSRTLELVYVGPQLETMNAFTETLEGIVVTVNVLDGHSCDFNMAQNALLKRFKRELQYNNEHILIDNTTFNNGEYKRNIEIYIKSHLAEKNRAPEYTFSTSSGTYDFMSA